MCSGGSQNLPPWVICTLCSSVMVVMFLQRNSIAETLSLMTIDERMLKQNFTPADCPYYYEHCRFEKKGDIGIGHYWSREMVLASHQAFAVGYISCQIPVGVVADWRGPRSPLGVGVMLSSVLCLALPTLANLGPYWFMAGHFLVGVAQSVLFPSTSSTVAQWSSVSKRATFYGFIIAGAYLGASISPGWFVLILMTNKLSLWRLGLYAPGLLGLAWCLVWLLYSKHSPPLLPFSPRPSTDQSDIPLFLLSKTVRFSSTPSRSQFIEHRAIDMPWRQIVRSRPFLSLVAVSCGYQWFQTLVMNMGIQGYMYHIQHLSKRVSRLSDTVMLATIPMSVAGGVFSDWLVENSFLSITFSRKLFIFIGKIVAVLFHIFIPLTGCDQDAYIALIVVIFFLSGLGEAAVNVNPIDLSPRHSGMLMGFMETTGGVFIILFREMNRLVLTEQGNVSQWNVIFFVTVVLVVIFDIPFLFFGSAEQQIWPIRHSTFVRHTPSP